MPDISKVFWKGLVYGHGKGAEGMLQRRRRQGRNSLSLKRRMYFPEGDYWMCTGVDRFDFVLKVSQLEKDIFEVKRIDI